MQNKTIEPLVSLVIVGAVFCLSLFVILQQEGALNKQLRATVFQPQEVEEEVGGQLVARAAQQMREVLASACLKDAYNAFEALWNQECESRDLKEKCDLPKAIAEPLLDEYQESKDECY